MFSKKIIYVFLVFFLITCSDNKNTSDKNIFCYNESSAINSLDPIYAKDQASIWAVSQIFNGLVQFDKNLNIESSIAKDWEISEDGIFYTFFLRNDVFFHNHKSFENKSRLVVSSDFVYSFNRLSNPNLSSSGSWVLNYINSFKAINDTIFQIKLNSAFPPFLGLLTMPYFFVVPEEIVSLGEFDRAPVGTGPFKYKIWKENVRLVLVKNDYYFEKDENNKPLPYLDGVAISFIKDKHVAFLEFLKGNLDFISGLDPKYKDEVLDSDNNVRDDYNINFFSLPYLNTEYLGFLMDDKDNYVSKNIRKAINYAINKKDMVKYLRKEVGYSGDYGIIPPCLPSAYYSSYGYGYNIDSVKKYLAISGNLGGVGLSPITLYTNSSYLDYCEFIQSECEKVGIVIKLEVMPPSVLRQSVSEGKASFFRASWIADYPSPENYFALFYSKNFAPNGPNYTHFNMAEYDSLYIMSLGVESDSLRISIYQEMDKILFKECPFIVLFYDQIMVFAYKNIEGLNLNPMNLLSIKKVKKN